MWLWAKGLLSCLNHILVVVVVGRSWEIYSGQNSMKLSGSPRPGLLATKSPNYFEVYHRHLQHFRRRRPHLLEIGLGSGGALEMWKDYFGRDLRVTGVECCPYPGMKSRLEDNITSIFFGDQEDQSFLDELVSSVPPFDIIVDDGSHVGRMQLASFRRLWPHLAPGGVYIIEDLQFAFENADAYQWIEKLKDLVSEMHIGRSSDPKFTEVGSIRSINIHRNIVVLEKYEINQGLQGFGNTWVVGAGAQAPPLQEAALWKEAPKMSHPV